MKLQYSWLWLFGLLLLAECEDKSMNYDDHPSLSAVETDFMNWVHRVGSRTHSSEAPAVTFNASTLVVARIRTLTVDKGGHGGFTSIQAAINTIPNHNNARVVIQIGAGVYQEKIVIPKTKPFITLQGAGRGLTTITWHDTASKVGSTMNSATALIKSDFFIAKDITFQNSAPPPSQGSNDEQAVALTISADKAAFYRCGFLSHQDTLFDAHGRHYFENCFIQGSIDFICGNGQSLYMGCELHALARSYGSLTAQKRSSPSESTGFSFVNCKVTGAGMVYLGRAWGPYSRVVFSYTYMDNIILSQGWFNWGDPKRQGTVFYGQYKCSGPGAYAGRRVNWSHELTAVQAAPFQSVSYIDGESWLQT